MSNKILSIDYKDWYLNQKRVPSIDSNEYEEFYDFHKKLCNEGFYMNNVFINPYLYWHLNFWNTEIDIIDDRGYIQQKYMNPYFRDNEWIIFGALWEANVQKKGLAIGGIRRMSKSVTEASYIAHGATFDENSQNVIAGLNAADIKLITDKIDKGLNFLPDAWKWQRVEDNWKNQVTLGIKTKDNIRIPFSQILIRNLEEGNNEEAIAGTKPRKLIIDEGGKGKFLRGLQAAIPGFTTPFGWGCSPIVTFTGGDMKKFQDAKTLMFDVDAFNFLEFKNEEDERRIHGLFLGHKYRLEAKEDSNLGDYLGIDVLQHVPMKVSNLELANKVTDDNLAKAKKAGDSHAFLKEKMYFPKTVDEIFLNEDDNIFKIELAKAQQNRIKSESITGSNVFLHHDGTIIKHEFTDKQPIKNFPHKGSDDKDAPIVIWEMPIKEAPFGLYVAGVDPYRQGRSIYSSSLGSVYIFKRIHDIASEKYQDMLVASYVARPDNKEKWQEQARLLIKFYNARTLVENDEVSFIDYMKSKNDAHYLERQPQWLKEVVPNTTQAREYGLSRAAQKVRDHLNNCIKRYMEEVIYQEKDENGSITREVLGTSKIFDYTLLEEIVQFGEDGNYDRIVAFSLALAMAYHLNPVLKVKDEDDDRLKSYQNINKKKKKGNSLFLNNIKTKKLFK